MTTQQSKIYINIKNKAKRAFVKRNYAQTLELLSYAYALSLDSKIQLENPIKLDLKDSNTAKNTNEITASNSIIFTDSTNASAPAINLDSINSKESLELKTLCALADMAMEYEEEARALFEYYQVITKKDKKDSKKDSTKKSESAEEIILDMVQNFDQNIYALNLAIAHLEDIEVDKNDGILYKDFENLEKEVGFREAFVDLMFSTKIIFTNKNEFLFFMQNLVKHGFREIAINYFENIGNMLYYDKDFVKLYQKILQNP
ncbi:hypothetical protein [Helicobacter turcicus]|uniref:Histidine kinase n=1 Tax=Helicobacter turcicus TaxID=2867412 RepID=A0ABS7JNI4_9HELI|nr:hypothetical protein [Helicobacter turcicus]MBX7490940.1 hypothetical protein [Helicobacter turcicus]MBX7545794.1 hypothetical protein [Helicobacter turcicus]